MAPQSKGGHLKKNLNNNSQTILKAPRISSNLTLLPLESQDDLYSLR